MVRAVASLSSADAARCYNLVLTKQTCYLECMQTSLRKMGNSVGMIVPKAVLQEIGLAAGAAMDVRVEEGKVVATPIRKVREGWAEDAARVAAAGLTGEETDWLGFGNDADADLTW